MSLKFIRRDSVRYSKLGRKKKRVWRRPKGRDNKMRLGMEGYPKVVSVGYKSPKKDSGRINGLFPVRVYNTKQLASIGKDSSVIVAKVGARKKLEIIREAEKLKLKMLNVKSEVKK